MLAIPRPSITKPKDKEEENLTYYGVIKKALTAKPTKRTLKLSKPKIISEKDNGEELLTDYGVIKEALTAVPSQRTMNLSKPRMVIYDYAYEKPYISPQALAAEASTRIIELAKPKKLHEEPIKKKLRRKRKIKDCVVKNEMETEMETEVETETETIPSFHYNEIEDEASNESKISEYSTEQVLKEMDLTSDKDTTDYQYCDSDSVNNVFSGEEERSCKELVIEISSLMKLLNKI